MLRLGFALLLLVAPTADAGAGEDAVFEARVDADPALGERVRLTLSASPASPIDRRFELQVPAWVAVEGDRVWRVEAAAGERVERAWNVTPHEAGFWRAGLAAEAEDGSWVPVAGCCLHLWSSQRRGIASPVADHALPAELAVGFHPSFSVLDAQSIQLAVRVTPQDKRYVGQQLRFESPVGEEDPQRAPSDAAHEFTKRYFLAPGDRALLSAAAFVEVTYADGPRMTHPAVGVQGIGCARFTLERVGDEVRELGRTGCSDAAPETSPAPPRRPVPQEGLWAALAIATGCAAARGGARARAETRFRGEDGSCAGVRR